MYKKDIEINAVTICNLLSDKGSSSIWEIVEHTNYKEAFILFALGWLAKENKIRFSERNGAMYIELSNPPISEIYF